MDQATSAAVYSAEPPGERRAQCFRDKLPKTISKQLTNLVDRSSVVRERSKHFSADVAVLSVDCLCVVALLGTRLAGVVATSKTACIHHRRRSWGTPRIVAIYILRRTRGGIAPKRPILGIGQCLFLAKAA
jgi:hypothetical protein